MKPINARTAKQRAAMPRDNISTKDFWLLIDRGYVVFAKQTEGKPAETSMRVPRAQFDRLVRWYVTGSIRSPSTGTKREERGG